MILSVMSYLVYIGLPSYLCESSVNPAISLQVFRPADLIVRNTDTGFYIF